MNFKESLDNLKEVFISKIKSGNFKIEDDESVLNKSWNVVYITIDGVKIKCSYINRTGYKMILAHSNLLNFSKKEDKEELEAMTEVLDEKYEPLKASNLKRAKQIENKIKSLKKELETLK